MNVYALMTIAFALGGAVFFFVGYCYGEKKGVELALEDQRLQDLQPNSIAEAKRNS